MKRIAVFFVLLMVSLTVYVGCQSTSSNDDVSISGVVINGNTGDPIAQAIVEITAPEEFAGTTLVTDENGAFAFSGITVSESISLTIEVKKTGFIISSFNVPVSGGLEIVLDQPIELNPESNGEGTGEGEVSGPSEGAAVIILDAISDNVLNIKETGGLVNTSFTFQVQDSAGRNLDLSNAVEVNFSIISGPGGGEGILPATVRTNATGKATSNLFSGSLAGVVQIKAEITRVDVGLTIESTPVAITIHGGFPTQDGFYLTSDITNLETSSSQETQITAKLVDEFSNPVKPGTAVYFSSTIGSIQGSQAGQSNDDGEVSVNFWCDGNLGSGVITARTVDGDNQEITKDLEVICSGSDALISVNPDQFQIEPGGSQRFDFVITDTGGRPMAKGTQVQILNNDASYAINGNTNFEIPNTVTTGPGKTSFSFVLEYFGLDAAELILPISVTSPSGQETTFNITGNSTSTQISGPSEGAANIVLVSVSEQSLNIKETGGLINSVLTFQVQDSSGRNLDIDNQVEVNFSILSGPEGGEGVLPATASTNGSGQVSTNFFSGNKAGVVQIQAEIVREDVGLTIRSKPIAISIQGGFPTQEGLDVQLLDINLEVGQETLVLTKLTDEFGNPVRQETAVYFTTTYGSVDGSGITNDRGEARNPNSPDGSVVLSCIGLGVSETGGSGVLTVSTVDANGTQINKDVNFNCGSSGALISATPLEFEIDAGGSESFTYKVTNLLGGPMPAGTNITVTAGTGVELTGSTNVTLGNSLTSGPGTTEFNFSLRDLGINADQITVLISVESPSGETTVYDQIRGNSVIDGVTGPPAGAAAIILTGITEEVINIQESGGTVNSAFTFQVQDSAGRNLDLNNQIEMSFSIVNGPNGGEGLLPEKAFTNGTGKVTTNLFSGTRAGVVMVQAEIVRADIGLTIRSRPVAVTIHGGFPDEDHFSLAPDKYNFEGYTKNGILNSITAILGDEFSNPVKPGTAVYFSSTGGIIEGSGQGNTNNQGFVNVNLISGGPRPNDSQTLDGVAFPRNGLATVTAQTIDKNNVLIEKSVNVVFSTSGASISANPTTFDLQPGGGETFTYTVTDLNGNPMAAGTSISVEAGEGMEVTGDANITLGNYIFPGPGATQFTFSIRDTDDESIEPADLSISITVVSPSGEETSLTPINGTRRKTF